MKSTQKDLKEMQNQFGKTSSAVDRKVTGPQVKADADLSHMLEEMQGALAKEKVAKEMKKLKEE